MTQLVTRKSDIMLTPSLSNQVRRRARSARRTSVERRASNSVRMHPFELLEDRQMLDSAGVLLNESPRLTLSFAPDSVQIGDAENKLFEHFEATFESGQWQDTILNAFQTWAVHTNADIGLVSETGQHDYGAAGPRSADERFGDIRIGARPLANQVSAISVPHNTLV